MTAVPGIKSFLGFCEKNFSTRVDDATKRKRVSGAEAARDGLQRKRWKRIVTVATRACTAP